MITPKLYVGGRNPGLVSNRRALTPRSDASLLRSWTLRNDNVTFNFIEDIYTGVRLESWSTPTTSIVYNKSRNLWAINSIRSWDDDPATERVQVNHYTLYPSKSNFIAPSLLPTVSSSGDKQFIFEWSGVRFDAKKPDYTCNVKVYATLPNNASYVDISIYIALEEGLYSTKVLERFNSCIVPSIQFPTIVIQKDSDETVNEDFTLSVPIGVGYTYFNPFKYLRSPRFVNESFQYDYEATRTYAAGQPGEPNASLTRFNFGSPGGMSIPAIVLGNKADYEGTLIYALDTEGTNAKGFQWYFDDEAMHLKFYHMSDNQTSPNALGGYDPSNIGYSMKNQPTWSLRIRPFKSPTRWVDWYGFKIFREEAVPEQVSYGWMGESFFNRYLTGEISKAAAEIPAVLNIYGITTGNLDAAPSAAAFYQDFYKNSVSPAVPDTILIPAHYQSVNLNYSPVRSTGVTDTAATYNGWEPWAGSGTGIGNVGPDVFKSPDNTGVNSAHTGGFMRLLDQGVMTYVYNIFPFTISSGSTWTIANSGMDLCTKYMHGEDHINDNDDYAEWARSGVAGAVFDGTFSACLSPNIIKEKYLEMARALANSGVGFYQDTAGLYGRGCYAQAHYYRDSLGNLLTHTHPTAGFSKYFNDLHIEFFREYVEAQKEVHSGRFPNALFSGNDLIFRHAAEFPCDAQLKNMPISLIYEPLGPIFNAFANEISNPRPDAIANTLAGTSIDTLSDLEIQLILALYPTLTHWACSIEPPNWVQRCPAYQIAYADRSVFNEWVAVYTTNAMSKYFNAGIITGVGTYGQVLRQANTEETQAMDWAAFTVQSWPLTNRISLWHLDNQISFVRPDLSGINNNHAEVYSTGIWSGYVNNLVKKLCRVQAYTPDYIYHGSFQQPLDTWTTESSDECTNTRSSRFARPPNVSDPYALTTDNDKAQHFVRKHRATENRLIVVGNWHSGSTFFNGIFDPLAYNITNSYQVYSIDVETEDHGTRTYLDAKNAGETYTFSKTLGEYEYYVLEIETNDGALDPELFGDLVTDYAPIRYSYDVQEITTSDTTLSYSYGSSLFSELDQPQVGYSSASTQQILNNLPQWTKMRQDQTSTGWSFTNSWGMSFDNVLENSTSILKDFNLVAADRTYNSQLNYIDIDSKEIVQNKTKRNILFNSAFSIKDVSRSNAPAGWIYYDGANSCYLNDRKAAVTATSICSDQGIIKVGQQIVFDNPLINRLVASIYVLAPSSDVRVRLHLSVEKIDGTAVSKSAILSNRSSEWVRLVLPVDVNDQVYRITYSVFTNCDGPVYISAPQLETSSISDWTNSIQDTLPYLLGSSRFNLVHATSIEDNSRKIPIHGIADESQFIDSAIPTRVERIHNPSKDLDHYTTAAFGRKISQLGEVFRVEYAVVEGQVVERSISPTRWDIFGRYDIRDLKYYEDLSFGTKQDSLVTIEPIAVAVRKEQLYVLCKETYNGVETRTLKIVRPRTPPNQETYLESFVDFNLDINFDLLLDEDQLEDEVYSIGFSDIDTDYMVVTTTNNMKYYYKLYFDYYYFDQSRNRLYTIESYPNAKLNVI